MQNRKRPTDKENKLVVTGGKREGEGQGKSMGSKCKYYV